MARTTWRPPVKPPVGAAEVDYGHPLAPAVALPCHEGAGPTYTMPGHAAGSPKLTGGGGTAATWTTTPYGIAPNFTTAGFTYESYPVGTFATGPGDFSVYFMARVTTPPGQGLSAAGSDGGAGQNDVAWGMAGNGGHWTLYMAGQWDFDSGIAPVNAHWAAVGIAYRRGVQAYFHVRDLTDGTLSTGTNANAATPGVGSGETRFGSGRDSADHWNNPIVLTYLWRRALTGSDFNALDAEPYLFLRPILRRRYSVPAVSPTFALDDTGLAITPAPTRRVVPVW